MITHSADVQIRGTTLRRPKRRFPDPNGDRKQASVTSCCCRSQALAMTAVALFCSAMADLRAVFFGSTGAVLCEILQTEVQNGICDIFSRLRIWSAKVSGRDLRGVVELPSLVRERFCVGLERVCQPESATAWDFWGSSHAELIAGTPAQQPSRAPSSP